MSNELDIKTLVSLVLVRAKTDKTEPDPKDLRSGWRTDALVQDIDALLVNGVNDPAAFAEFGRLLFSELQELNLPEVKELARLAILRGERLLTLDQEQIQTVLDLSKSIRTSISLLPAGTRKKRCEGLFLYNTGIFYDALGRFKEAAETQEWAAREAGEGSSSAAISFFTAALYRLKQALLDGKPNNELRVPFSNLEERFDRLTEALRGSELQVQWAEGNGPIHMIMACLWLNRQSHSKWDDWVDSALTASKKLGEAWKTSADLIHAENNARALMAVAENNAAGNEVKATALLLLARLSPLKNEIRSLIEKMPETGAQHIRAVAERLITPIK